MYTRNILNKILQIKNLIFTIAGVFGVVASANVVISLLVNYRENIEIALDAVAIPGAIAVFVGGMVLLLLAFFSNKSIGDANFYSSYFEGDLDGRINITDLAMVMGKSADVVNAQLHWFRLIYMKGFNFERVNNVAQVVLASKKIVCQCNKCGGEIEKNVYYIGRCSYCGGLDLNARVLVGDRFYSIKTNIAEGLNNPEYYQLPKLKRKKLLGVIIMGIGLFFTSIGIIGFADNIGHYNDRDYIIDLIMSGKTYTSIELVKAEILELAITFAAVFIGFLPVLFNGIKRLEYVHATRTSSEYFAKRKTPFVKLWSIPIVKKRHNKKRSVRVVREALRKRYLRNCTFEIHKNELMLVLAKRIVKEQCPSCGAQIVGPAHEHYRCGHCGKTILYVIKSK